MANMASGEHKIELRRDQIDQFVSLYDKRPVEWLEARGSRMFHASANGITALCRFNIKVCKSNTISSHDRSSDVYTCQKCQELVRRVRRGR